MKKFEFSLMATLVIILILAVVATTATRTPAEPKEPVKQTFQDNFVLKRVLGPEKAKLLDSL